MGRRTLSRSAARQRAPGKLRIEAFRPGGIGIVVGMSLPEGGGADAEEYDLRPPRPAIRGRAWCGPDGQEPWHFTLLVGQEVRSREESTEVGAAPAGGHWSKGFTGLAGRSLAQSGSA
jgi:hypothetical protein